MEILQQRINDAMRIKRMKQVDLAKESKEDPSKVSQLVNGKVKDPRFSTVINIARALDVSLDYLAGLTDNPEGFCGEEIPIDVRAQHLLRGFELLPPEGKDAIQDQVDFQLSKSRDKAPSERLPAAPMEVA